MDEETRSGLQTSERVLVGCFLIALTALCAFSFFHRHRRGVLLRQYSQEIIYPIQIRVSGAVSKPGIYEFAPGVALKDVLRKCRPKKLADLTSFNLEMKIEQSVHFEIPEIAWVQVEVGGAVQHPAILSLPIGSRVSDLLAHVELLEGADGKVLKSRRLLKEGEVFLVPMKNLPR